MSRTHLLFSILVIVSLLFLYLEYSNIKSFRKKQDYTYFKKSFTHNNPVAMAKRLLIIKSGSKIYNDEIHKFMFRVTPKEDFLNKYIYKKEFQSLDAKKTIKYYLSYPFKKEDIRNAVIKKAQIDTSGCKILESIDKYHYIISSFQLNKDVLKCLVENDIISKYNKYYIKDLIQTGTAESKYYLNKILDLPYAKISPYILSAFSESKELNESDMVFQYYKRNLRTIPSNDINTIFKETKDSNKLFEALDYKFNIEVKINDTKNAVETFHKMIHLDLIKAETAAKLIIQSKDTRAKKSIIIYLVRHNSLIGGENIDISFKRGPKPITYYRYPKSYIYGSQAAKQYIYISRHDYLETGKTYPPSYCKPPLDDETKLWEKFIFTYPWFPGTDDAYFRLAFRYLANGEYDSVNKTLLRYRNASFIDDDVKELMTRIEKDSLNRVHYNINSVFNNSTCYSTN